MAIKKGQWTDQDTGDILYPQTSADMIVQDSGNRFVTDTEKSTWNRKANASHTHTKSQITDFPTSLKNPTTMTVQLNGGTTEGTNKFQYDGSVAKTVNITPSSIGASASSHTHNYAGSSSAGGSANSAVKLDTSAGSATRPVYFSGGKPVACTYTLGKSVPSNAVFTDTTYGVATTGTSGLMSSTDKTKLDGIENGANKYIHPSTHAATMIVEDATHRFTTDAEKENWNNIPRDNILINSDFRQNAINQRNSTTYGAVSAWTYCIDRWIYFGQMSVNRAIDRITLQANSSNSGYSYFKQLVEGCLNGTYTLYINVLEISGEVRADVNSGVALKTGENIITFTTPSGGQGGVQINLIGTSAKIVISHMKLEEGTVYTGMPAWNRTLELLKCFRYFFRINNLSRHYYFNAVWSSADTASGYIQLPVMMRTTPTMNFAGIYLVKTSDGVWKSVQKITDIGYGSGQVQFVCTVQSGYLPSVADLRGMVQNVPAAHLTFDAEIY